MKRAIVGQIANQSTRFAIMRTFVSVMIVLPFVFNLTGVLPAAPVLQLYCRSVNPCHCRGIKHFRLSKPYNVIPVACFFDVNYAICFQFLQGFDFVLFVPANHCSACYCQSTQNFDCRFVHDSVNLCFQLWSYAVSCCHVSIIHKKLLFFCNNATIFIGINPM